MSKDIISIGALVLALLVLLILVGVTFVVSEKFKENICTATDSTFSYTAGSCVNTTGDAQTIEGITQSEVVEAAIVTVLSFLAIVVIVLIAKIIIRVARSMSDE